MVIRRAFGNNFLRSASLSTSSLQSSLIFRLNNPILSLCVMTNTGVYPVVSDVLLDSLEFECSCLASELLSTGFLWLRLVSAMRL